jgi:hypothetical protein
MAAKVGDDADVPPTVVQPPYMSKYTAKLLPNAATSGYPRLELLKYVEGGNVTPLFK